MDLSKILSIAGKNGLFKVVSQAKNAVIVQSLNDDKRFPAFGHEKMSSLEEISVFTTGEDIPLKAVFKSFHDQQEGKPAIDPKSDNESLKKFFLGMVPNYDQERVYVSHIKKIVSWYNMLLEKQLLDFTEEKSETVSDEISPANDPEPEKTEKSE